MSSAPPEIPIAKKTYLSASSDDNSSDEEEAVLNAGKTVDIQSNGTANEKSQRLRSEVKFSLLKCSLVLKGLVVLIQGGTLFADAVTINQPMDVFSKD